MLQSARFSMKRWFKQLYGFEERIQESGNATVADYLYNQQSFRISTGENGDMILTSCVNNRSFPIGRFSTPSLGSLREAALAITNDTSKTTTYEHVAISDVLKMHSDNPGATFQAASQFNCLEFPSPDITPECGITGYAFDNTQGPACAVACASGTIYRNYFAVPKTNPVGVVGQTCDSQINNLDDLEDILINSQHGFWSVKNGYTFSDSYALQRLEFELDHWRAIGKFDQLVDSVKVGLHANVGVDFVSRFKEASIPATVTQVYCSALSCAYSDVDNSEWAPLAQLVLDASYEATVWAAVLNRQNVATAGSRNLFLTMLGGGVFGNDKAWIGSAIGRAIAKASIRHADINIVVCHYRKLNPELVAIIDAAYLEEIERLAAATAPVTSS
jgi:hypothetical protein